LADYGMAVYGVDTYVSTPQVLTGITNVYLGNELYDNSESNFIADQLIIFNRELSDAEILTLSNSITPADWDDDTIFLAPLDNTLNAGNLSGAGVNITSWRIYRKKSTESVYILLDEQDNAPINEYYDLTVAGSQYYDYAIEGISDDGRITPKYTSLLNILDFDGFWILDQESNTSFQFLYNVPSVSVNSDRERQEFKTFSKYPIIHRGIYNVKKGQLSTTIDEDIFESIEILEDMEGKNLILKFDTGQIYLVDIYNINYTLKSDYVDDEDCEIKVDWVEVGAII
jgi:hypothetical protein